MPKTRRLLSLVATLLALYAESAQTAPCQLCSDGSTIPLTDQEISLPSYPFVTTCGDLQTILPLIAENSTQCFLLQSLESICGCPVPDNACQLCGSDNGTNLTNPDGELPFLSFLFDDIIPTCEMYEAYLRSFNDTSSDCIVGQAFISEYCGCGGTEPAKDEESCSICPGGEMIGNPDANINIPGFPFRTCHELNQAVDYVVKADTQQCDLVQSVSTLCGCEGPPDPCTLCWDGSPIVYPDKDVEWAKDLFLGIAPTCSLFEAYVAGLSSDDSRCGFAQSTGTHCGCPPLVEDHCVFCDDGFSEELAQVVPPFYSAVLEVPSGIQVTCEFVESIQSTLKHTSGSCLVFENFSYQCGCHGGVYIYWGTNSEATRILLVWLLRFSSLLSLLGAGAIQFDVLRSKERRRQTYNQLVFCMSLCDIATALAMIFGPLLMPKERPNYGTHGNNTTCTIQGFFIQLGLTSVFFNLSLTVYYKLTILDGWKEDKFRQKRLLFFGIPTLVGVILAFAGIPYYMAVSPFCYLQPLPLVDNYPQVLGLAVLPIMVGIVSLTSLIVYIYCRFRERRNQTRKWRFGGVRQRITMASSSTKSYQRRDDNDDQAPRVLHASNTIGRDSSVPSSTESEVRERGTLQQASQRRQNRSKDKLVEKMFGQAVAYIVAFYITWPILTAAEIYGGLGNTTPQSFWFWCVVVVAAPLQGFNNAWIYFRPRIQRARRRRRRGQNSPPEQNKNVSPQRRRRFQFSFLGQSLVGKHHTQRASSVVTSSRRGETPLSALGNNNEMTVTRWRSTYEPSAALANDELLKSHIDDFLDEDDDDDEISILGIVEEDEEESGEESSGAGAKDAVTAKTHHDLSDSLPRQSDGLTSLASSVRQQLPEGEDDDGAAPSATFGWSPWPSYQLSKSSNSSLNPTQSRTHSLQAA